LILARANGQPLEKSGYPARNVKRAIDLAAGDLLVGNHVSNEALILAAKPLVPTWLFMFFANRGWKQQAKHTVWKTNFTIKSIKKRLVRKNAVGKL